MIDKKARLIFRWDARTHREDIEKIVKQAEPQFVGVAGKTSSVHLQI